MIEGQAASTGTATRARGVGGWPVRVHLADLMIWVLGAGVAAAVCREARPAAWLGPSLDLARILGLLAAILAIFMGIALFRQVVARVSRRRAEGGTTRLIAVGWRLVVMGLLGASLAAEGHLLGGDVLGDDWSRPEAVRLRLLPLALMLALAGILASLAPAPGSGQHRKAPRTMAWLSVVWAAGAGVMIATSQAVIPYLVLLAMEAVRNALSGPVASQPIGPNLHARVLRASAEAAPVLACCVVLGLLVARDLQRPGPAPHPRPRPGARSAPHGGLDFFALLAATAATGAGGAWLVAVTLPGLDGWLAEGLRVVVDPLNAAIIVLGFAGLALGPAARAADRPGPAEPDPLVCQRRVSYGSILGKLTIGLMLLDFIAARAIDLIVARRATAGGPVNPAWTRWVGWVDAAFNWVQSILPNERQKRWYLFETPEWLALALLQGWVAWRVAVLLVTSTSESESDQPSPIDAHLTARPTTIRFALRWAALTVLMVAALPALFLAGLALLHALIRFTA